jgi:hypothetical protein
MPHGGVSSKYLALGHGSWSLPMTFFKLFLIKPVEEGEQWHQDRRAANAK